MTLSTVICKVLSRGVRSKERCLVHPPPVHPFTSPPLYSYLNISYMPDTLWVESLVTQNVVGEGDGFFGL